MSRPMAERAPGAGDGDTHGDHGAPYGPERRALLASHHRRTLWIPWTLVALGLWTARYGSWDRLIV